MDAFAVVLIVVGVGLAVVVFSGHTDRLISAFAGHDVSL